MASDERSRLLPVASQDSNWKQSCKLPFCLRSKTALLVLLWNLPILLAYKMVYNINTAVQITHTPLESVLATTVITFVAVFSPVAGLLTDIKFSRNKTVVYSSYAIFTNWLVICLLVTGCIVLERLKYLPAQILGVFLFAVCSFFIIYVIIYIVFIVNAFQFGMDQLHDSPTEDSILFIHWYVWIYYLSSFVAELTWNCLFYDNIYLTYADYLRISGSCLLVLVLYFVLHCSLHLCVFFAGTKPCFCWNQLESILTS